MKKMTQTPLRSKQKILRKQPKQRDLSKSNKIGKTYLLRKVPTAKSKSLCRSRKHPSVAT